MSTHLPVARPSTAFVHERVAVGQGLEFVIDGNSKITAGNGTYEAPAPNALSLPAASVQAPANPSLANGATPHCPGSTPACRASCYVRGLAKHAPDVYAAYAQNFDTLTRILDGGTRTFLVSAATLGMWISAHCSGGFRWHVSGDVLDRAHALWIFEVCAASRYTRHWIYTRTLSAVDRLVRAPNLTVNLSSDRDNVDQVRGVHARYPKQTRIAHMVTAEDAHEWSSVSDTEIGHCRKCLVPLMYAGTPDNPGPHLTPDEGCPGFVPPAGSVIFPDYALRGRELADPTSAPWWQGLRHDTRRMVCPADFFGQSESHRCGPCNKCIQPAGETS